MLADLFSLIKYIYCRETAWHKIQYFRASRVRQQLKNSLYYPCQSGNMGREGWGGRCPHSQADTAFPYYLETIAHISILLEC